jgi:hypothetical protein
MRHYIDKRDKAWVEELDDRVVVSWPRGQRILSYDEPVPNLLAAIREAVISLMEEKPDDRTIKRAKSEAFNEGYKAGWEDRKREEARQASNHPGSSRRGTVRTVDTGTKL